MPDTDALRDAVRRSAFGHFSERPDETPWQTGNRIIERMNIPPGSDRIRVQNYVRAARRQYDEGRAEEAPELAGTPFVPSVRDPSLQGEIAEYRYRTVVEITDPNTGDTYSTVVIVDSTRPLTPDEIRRDARATWTDIRGPDRNYYDRSQIPSDWEAEVRITGGGRA